MRASPVVLRSGVVVNLNTPEGPGFTVPQSVLLRADEVIQ
jgi:hypothetical protein